MTKRGVKVKCCKCGITDRHQDPFIFILDGWCASDNNAFCPECSKILSLPSDDDSFEKYFNSLKAEQAKSVEDFYRKEARKS